MKIGVREKLRRAQPLNAGLGSGGGGKHSSHYPEKIELRRLAIAALGGIEHCRILETHAGPGVMRSLCYKGAADILSVDTDPRSPDAVIYDSKLVLRAVDLQRFNLFDVDAFGSPFEHLWLISKRRSLGPGELVAFVITCGSTGGLARLGGHTGLSPERLREVGINPDAPVRQYTAEHGHVVIQKAIAAWFHKAAIVSAWGMAGPVARYDTIIIKG